MTVKSLRWFNPQIAILTKKIIGNELAWMLQNYWSEKPTNPDLAMGLKENVIYERSGA